MKNYTKKIVYTNMDVQYVNEKGEFHRTDGPACEYANGEKSWYLNGELHRLDGPAIEYASGTKCWFINGKLHREDGPASVWVHVSQTEETWYLHDIRYKKIDFLYQTRYKEKYEFKI